MKNSFIGIGILSLLFSFSLLLPGISRDKESLGESFFSQVEEVQYETQLHAWEIDLQEGNLFGRTENRDFYQVGRKLPATLSFLFLLINYDIEEISESFYGGLSYCPVKDLPVTNQNLRI